MLCRPKSCRRPYISTMLKMCLISYPAISVVAIVHQMTVLYNVVWGNPKIDVLYDLLYVTTLRF